MPRTPIPVAGITKTGVDAPQAETADPVNGNTVANSDGQTQLIISNTGAITHTVAVRLTATVDGLPVNSRVITVPAGQKLLCGGYPYWWYGPALLLDPSHADLRISALRLGEGLPIAAPTARFSLSGTIVAVADTSFGGLTVDGSALVVDTTATASTVDGDALVITV